MNQNPKLAETIFDRSVIEDHALRQGRGLRRISSNIFAGATSLDTVTQNKGCRTARSVTGGPSEGSSKTLKNTKHAPFWQLGPDEKTIERVYNPEDEPLVDIPS